MRTATALVMIDDAYRLKMASVRRRGPPSTVGALLRYGSARQLADQECWSGKARDT